MSQNPYVPQLIDLNDPSVVLFMRHGQCRSNIEWPIEFYTDGIDGLTDIGKKQALAGGRELKSLFSQVSWKIWSSGLSRAIETATIIAAIVDGCLVDQDGDINEFAGEDKETYESLRIRINNFLEKLTRIPNRDYERRLVVTHGHVLEYLLVTGLGLPRPKVVDKGSHGGQMGLASHANCGISAFSFPHNRSPELLLWNHHSHLLIDQSIARAEIHKSAS
jgi:broad specificity phosphatase PhoE